MSACFPQTASKGFATAGLPAPGPFGAGSHRADTIGPEVAKGLLQTRPNAAGLREPMMDSMAPRHVLSGFGVPRTFTRQARPARVGATAPAARASDRHVHADF